MKQCIILLLLLALFSGLLIGCAKPDAKYAPPSEKGDYKWVCDEIDMWFLNVKQGNDTYFLGELTVDDKTTTIIVDFPIGGGPIVSDFFGFDDLIWDTSRHRLGGDGRFHKGWFTLKVDEEYVDYVGFEKLKFRRVELDEKDLAWIEVNYPESLPEEDGIGAEQTEAP